MDFDNQDDINDFEEEFSPLSVENAEDRLILMHKDAHFGGNFEQMLLYYASEGKGVQEEIDLKRIRELASIENERKIDLSKTLLSDGDRAQISKIHNAYVSLRELYEIENPKTKIPRLLADLILSEDEDPVSEIDAIAALKDQIVPQLLELLNSESMSDPLYPGYGFAPELAARCLAKIGDKRAIISLFEAIGSKDIYTDEASLMGLKAIGEPAKRFLMGVLRGKPLSWDNVRAATALIHFHEDPEVATTALNMLFESDTLKNLPLASELLLICEGLKDPLDRERFQQLALEPAFPKDLKFDHSYLAKQWV